MDKKRGVPFDVVMALVLMAIVASIAIDGIFIQQLPWDALQYPIFCFTVFFVACLIDIWHSISKRSENNKGVHTNIKNFYITLLMFVVYCVLTYLLGFIIASIALTIAFTLYFKVNKPIWVNIGAAIVIVALYIVFGRVLYIFLPKGIILSALI